jgi:hypothetical protein
LPGGCGWSSGKRRGSQAVIVQWPIAWATCSFPWVSYTHQRRARPHCRCRHDPGPDRDGHHHRTVARAPDRPNPANRTLTVPYTESSIHEGLPLACGTLDPIRSLHPKRTTGTNVCAKEVGPLRGSSLLQTARTSLLRRPQIRQMRRLRSTCTEASQVPDSPENYLVGVAARSRRPIRS